MVLFSDYTTQLPYDVYENENGEYMKELTRWGNRTVTYNPLYEATLW